MTKAKKTKTQPIVIDGDVLRAFFDRECLKELKALKAELEARPDDYPYKAQSLKGINERLAVLERKPVRP